MERPKLNIKLWSQIITITLVYKEAKFGCEIKEDDIGKTCSTLGGEKFIQKFSWKPPREWTTWKT
jgi:hypothetical protein